MNVIARIAPVGSHHRSYHWCDEAGGVVRSWRLLPGALDLESAAGRPVFINHRLLSDVGRVVRAWEDEHWIRAELELDPCKVPLRVLANPAGVAVSVGLDARTVGSGDDEIVTSAKLEEVSIVPDGNGLHRGARIEQLVATAGASALTSGAGPPTWRDDTGKKLRRTSGRVIRVT